MRHKRKLALREADLVLLAGVPCDFRLDYGGHIQRGASLISANRSPEDLRRNRRPTCGILGDAAEFLRALAETAPAGAGAHEGWISSLRARDDERNGEIERMASIGGEFVNPIALCRELDAVLDDDSILVADGGDFVATASYTASPRAPLSWLDPGVFGTLGVGAGFALGARVVRPSSEIWIVYGDGSAAYSIAEIDTFCRHGMGVIALVGNDASWRQIARDQVAELGDDVGTQLRRTEYQRVAAGFGGVGFSIERPEEVSRVLAAAKEAARGGAAVLINAQIDLTDFREGSISM